MLVRFNAVLQSHPGKNSSPAYLDVLPNASEHQPLVVAARLPLDPARQVVAVPLLVCPSDVGHVVAVPV